MIQQNQIESHEPIIYELKFLSSYSWIHLVESLIQTRYKIEIYS